MGCFGVNIIKKLSAYLLIQPEQLAQHDPDVWKVSVLRIVLFAVLILVASIMLTSILRAYQLNQYPFIFINIVLYSILVAALVLPVKRFRVSASILVYCVVLISYCILQLSGLKAFSDFGIIFLYLLPILTRIFFSLSVAYLLMIVNTVIFLVVISCR